ncbi:MAG: hypothetical protein R3323_11045, partial [Wenzhouxiangellaceae bacterium]|nr:hypothetical protein [Wenzhouxiangellaceae bacterium]
VIAQARVEVRPGDDAPGLAARVLEREHRLLPAVLALLARLDVGERDGYLPERAPLVLDRDLDDHGRVADGRGAGI